MTEAQFQNELESYIGRLANHEPSSAKVNDEEIRAFPYPVGYFNNQGNPYKGN